MRKTVIALSTTSVLLFGGLTISDTVSANTVDELKQKQSKIKDERAKVKKDLSKAEAKIADVLFDLEELNEEIKELEVALEHNEKALKQAKENIKKLEQEIDQLEEEIAQLAEKIEQRTEILKDRISAYQKTGGNIDILEVILGSQNFSDLISRVSAVMKITNADQELIDQQELDKEIVEEKQLEVEEKLAEEVDLKNEIEAIKADMEEQQEDLNKKKKSLKKEEKKLKDLVAELEDEDSSLAQLEAAVRQELDEARRAEEEALVTLASSQSNNSDNSDNSDNQKPSNNSSTNVTSAPKGGAVSAALSRVGKNNYYVWGGKDPATGFDCSGFVSWAYGGSVPSSTSALQNVGTKISIDQAQPGDLIFFDTYKKNGHVGIYLGNGQWVGSQSSTGVAVASINGPYWKDAFKGHVRRVN